MFSQKKKMELDLYKMSSITGTHKNEKFYKLFFFNISNKTDKIQLHKENGC